MYIGPYGTLTGHGRIIDIETNAIIIDDVYIHFNDFIVDENISMDEIEDIFNSIDDSYLHTAIINGLKKL